VVPPVTSAHASCLGICGRWILGGIFKLPTSPHPLTCCGRVIAHVRCAVNRANAFRFLTCYACSLRGRFDHTAVCVPCASVFFRFFRGFCYRHVEWRAVSFARTRQQECVRNCDRLTREPGVNQAGLYRCVCVTFKHSRDCPGLLVHLSFVALLTWIFCGESVMEFGVREGLPGELPHRRRKASCH
jgi:hypothetical protein